MTPCAAARRLIEAAKAGHGGAPGFTAAHLLLALKAVASEPGIGRPKLQALLGLGEAATRTLISRLAEAGLARRAPRGLRPSEEGLRVLKTLSRAMIVEETPEALVEEWGATMALFIAAPPPRSLTDVYRVRDYLVEEGCRLAVIGGVSGGSVEVPGAPGYLASRIEQVAPQGIGEATVIVVPSECMVKALNAALRLLASNCS